MIVLVLRQKRNSDLAFRIGAGIAEVSSVAPVPSPMDLRISLLVLMVGVYWLLVIGFLFKFRRFYDPSHSLEARSRPQCDDKGIGFFVEPSQSSIRGSDNKRLTPSPAFWFLNLFSQKRKFPFPTKTRICALKIVFCQKKNQPFM
jgi:hypothetical protein